MRGGSGTGVLAGFLFIMLFSLSTSAEEAGGSFFGAEGDGRSLSLEECVRISIYNSFEVKLAKLDFAIAETDRRYAESVFDTNFSGVVEYSEDKSQQLSVFAADDNQTNTYSAGVTKKLKTGTELEVSLVDERAWNNTAFVTRNPSHGAKLLLEARQPAAKNFFGYVDRRSLSVTKLAIKNADLAARDRIEELLSKVIAAYWDLVFSGRSVEIHRKSLEKAEKLHQANSRNYDIGLIEKGDFLASRANVILRRTDLLDAENTYRRNEENLKLFMNIEKTVSVLPSGKFNFPAFEYKFEDCIRMAFENSRDYRSKKRDIEIKNISVKMKENELWPEVDLIGSLAMNGIERKFVKAVGRTTVLDNTRYSAGIEVTLPFENNLARSEFNKALHEQEKALVTLKEKERALVTDVGNSFRDVMTYIVSVDNYTEAVALQAEKLQEEEKRFANGRSSTKKLIDYQQDLLNAEVREAKAKLDLEKANVDLERSMNVILEKYEEVI